MIYILLVCLQAILALVVCAKQFVDKDPYNGSINSIFKKTDKYLKLYSIQKMSMIFDMLLKFSYKVIIYCFIMLIPIFLLPSKIQNVLWLLVAPFFAVFILINLSISWIQYHQKTLKELLYNKGILFVLFFPLISYAFEFVFPNAKFYSSAFEQVYNIFNQVNIFYIQLTWIILLAGIFYVGSFIIATPIYFGIFFLILITRNMIKRINKYTTNLSLLILLIIDIMLAVIISIKTI